MLSSVTAQFVATWLSIVGSDTVSKFHRGVMPGFLEADQQCGLSFASHRALMAHSTAAHATVSFASRFVFDVYCLCCLTLLHTRQRVHEHFVDGKRRCLQALAASVELASDALVQQLP